MSTDLKDYGYLRFGCCIIARQNAITMLRNMLKTSLVFEKSEPQYAYKLYAYR